MMTMVGDAYAAPLVEELQQRSYELSSLYAIGTGGAATNPEHQRALLELLPQLTLINGYGSSETGNMGFGHSKRGTRSDTFTCARAGWCCQRTTRDFSSPASQRSAGSPAKGESRWATSTMPRRHPQDLPGVEGQRVVISGDRARSSSDGTLRLFGRDSLVVNTGGEKVFVEEVEEVLRAHPAVADALVVGRPSERWGEELVALVALQPGADGRARRAS